MDNLKKIADRVFQKNKEVIESSKKDVQVPPHIYLFNDENNTFDILELEFTNNREKALMTFYVRSLLLRDRRYAGYIFVTEAYAATVRGDDQRQPRDIPGRVEILMLMGRTRAGDSVFMKAELKEEEDHRTVSAPDVEHEADGGDLSNFFNGPTSFEMDTFVQFLAQGGQLEAFPSPTTVH